MARLANNLGSFFLDRHVFDNTGMGTRATNRQDPPLPIFDIHLEFGPDGDTPGGLEVDTASDIPRGPSIFAAIEQLGLKLETTRGPHGIIVIDHIERPSGN